MDRSLNDEQEDGLELRVLLVPSNDWMTHPNPMRHHFIFTRLAQKYQCKIYVLSFDGLGRRRAIINPRLVLNENIQPIGEGSFRIPHPALYYALNSKRVWDVLNRALEEFDMDIVVNSNLLPSAIASVLARRMHVPVVYDCIEYYPQSASTYFKTLLMKTLVSRSVREIMEYLICRSDAVITVSSSHARLVREIDPGKWVEVVPNGVDLELFRARGAREPVSQQASASKGLRLVYVGSVDEWLDLWSVFSAIQYLKREGLSVSLTIVGGCHAEYYAERVASLVESFGLEEDVVFTGFVPHHLVPSYINAADVALAPYRNVAKNDGTPLKIAEYLACQKPVLCTRIPEIVRRFGNHLCLYDGSEELIRLLRLMPERSRILQRRLENVRQTLADYSWDTLAARYHQILQSVVHRRNMRQPERSLASRR